MKSLNGAVMAIDKKDWASAITSYQNVAGNKSVDKSYRDLAIVQMVSLQLDHDSTVTGANLLKSLEPVIADQKSPWNSKAIFISSLKATKKNDLKGAQDDLGRLSSMPNLPSSFAEQVTALNEVYKIKKWVQNNEKNLDQIVCVILPAVIDIIDGRMQFI